MFLLCLQNSFTNNHGGSPTLLFSETHWYHWSQEVFVWVSISWPTTNSIISKDLVTVTTLDSLYHVTNVGGFNHPLEKYTCQIGFIFPKGGMKMKICLKNLKPPPRSPCLLYFRRGTDMVNSWKPKPMKPNTVEPHSPEDILEPQGGGLKAPGIVKES